MVVWCRLSWHGIGHHDEQDTEWGGIGLRLFETVNKDNIASYRLAMSASNVGILEELDGKDLYLEILKV